MGASNKAQLNHYCSLHCKHLKLKGLQAKTIDAYSFVFLPTVNACPGVMLSWIYMD